MTEISFITPVYNNASTLGKSIEAMLAQSTKRSFEIIVIDDGSTDDSAKIALSFSESHKNIKVISKENGGEASALNVGVKEASGKYICIAEGDVELEPDWIEKNIKEFDDPQVMGVGGHLVTPRNDPWIARIAGYEVEHKLDKNAKYVSHITSANAMYRAEIFEEVGTYNEKLINSCLDADVNLRIIDKGYKLVYNREAKALHHYKTTLFGFMNRVYYYARYRPHLQSTDLYERDMMVSVQVFLAMFFLLSMPLIPFMPPVTYYISPAILCFATLLLLPTSLKFSLQRKDWVMLLYPVVVICKSFFGLFGYGIGVLQKLRGKY